MMRIKLLDENLINQIAAGEVIERPASVVKELVENSIDAGAKKIEIEISNGARDIRVADNGNGIHKEDIALAFSRHATSKIQTQKDLWDINTLGFRGEALASIISIAKVTCTTKTPDEQAGLKAECENSEIKISETGCAVGTIMEIKELFYNVPARLKFLKQHQTENSNITEIVQNIAISHPEVAINLINKKCSIIKTTGSADLATVVGEIYSKELIKELSEVNFEDNQFNLKLNGLISNPDYTRSNRKAIYVFVNGRIVKCQIILKAIDTVFKDLVPFGKYPFAVLNMTIPPQEIDVNVHPSKKEVKYSKPNLIFNFVYSAIKSALEGKEHMNSFKQLQNNEFEQVNNHLEYENNQESAIMDFSKFSALKDNDIIEVSIPLVDTNSDYSQNKLEFVINNKEFEFFNKPKIIGQLDNTYILIESDAGLQIIDQHIAHERYIYEKLKETKNSASQLLLTSFVFETDEEQGLIIKDNLEILTKYGFELEFVQNEAQKTGIKLKRIPQMLADKDHEKIFFDIIEAIKTTPENIENEILEKIACKAAVKAGEKLSLWQMEELIANWQRTAYNKTCPHGRKISHIINKGEIAKFFGRTSVNK